MVRYGSALVFAIAWGPSAWAQPAAMEPPTINRPTNFSEVSGQYDIKVNAQPTSVHVEEAIRLTISITGKGPKDRVPNREYIDRLFPSYWADDFYVQELPDEHRAMPDQDTWTFVYRLKPKHVKVKEIKGIEFVFFNPALPGKRKFVTKDVDPIEIKVSPKPDTTEELEVKGEVAPDTFYHLANAREIASRSQTPWRLNGLFVALLLAGPPILCIVFVLFCRRLYPNSAQQSQSRRGRAAGLAFARLDGGENSWEVISDYLRGRFDFPALDATPDEVSAFLKRRGFALELCAQSASFLRACDATQWVGADILNATSLAGDARSLIENLEADPCARR